MLRIAGNSRKNNFVTNILQYSCLKQYGIVDMTDGGNPMLYIPV